MRPLHPQGAVGIQKNVLSTRIAEASCDKRPQLTSQLLVPPDYDLLQLDHSVPNLWLASLYSACYMYLARSMEHLCTLRFRACQGEFFMAIKSTDEAVQLQAAAMHSEVFEVGLFDPNSHRQMLPRVWDRNTLLRSISWLRLKNGRGRNIY